MERQPCCHKKSFKYRKHLISPYKDGWIVDLPDDNIYANQYCVKNAVDLALGGNESRKSISENVSDMVFKSSVK